MSDIDKLLPCPFCGGKAELVYSNDNHHQPHVQCRFGSSLTPKCPCHNTYQWSYNTEKEAIEAWNGRCKESEEPT